MGWCICGVVHLIKHCKRAPDISSTSESHLRVSEQNNGLRALGLLGLIFVIQNHRRLVQRKQMKMNDNRYREDLVLEMINMTSDLFQRMPFDSRDKIENGQMCLWQNRLQLLHCFFWQLRWQMLPFLTSSHRQPPHHFNQNLKFQF